MKKTRPGKHCITIFTYGIFLNKEMITPFIGTINPLKLRDIQNLRICEMISDTLTTNLDKL